MPYLCTNLLPLVLLVFVGLGHGSSGLGRMSGSILDHKDCVAKPLDGDANCAIECNFSDDFTVDGNSLPSNVSELSILGGGNIQFDSQSFSKIDNLRLIVVRKVRNLTIKALSFLNLSSQYVQLEISYVIRLEIQSEAFYLPQGPITVLIADCPEVIVEIDAIPWIQELTIKNVPNLQLKEVRKPSDRNSKHKIPKKVPALQKINLIGVTTEELPPNSFPSSTKEIMVAACNIKTLRSSSISVTDGENITIRDSNISVIESRAFKSGSYFKKLILLEKVSVDQLQSEAILSAVTNFTVIDSTIQMVHEHAFSMQSTKNVLFNSNHFADIKMSGIKINLGSYKTATITNNTLRKLSTNAIKVQLSEDSQSGPSEFVFEGNIFDKLDMDSLQFNLTQIVPFKVSENIFLHLCDCNQRAAFNEFVVGDSNLIDTMYNNSYCALSTILSNCFHHPENFMKTSEYVQKVCEQPMLISCPDGNGSATITNPNIDKIIDGENKMKLFREHQVIFLAILVACAGILAILVLTACLWFSNRKPASRGCHLSNFGHHLRSYLTHFIPSNPMVRSRSTNSITRVPVHDYDDVLPPKYVDSDEDTYICIDKATQTLPEELTQELLQALRDKLDDPENYREARCMIEHLYDLIKVEECCNHNLLNEDILADLSPDEGVDILTDTNENLYDIIGLEVLQQRRHRKSYSSRRYVHKGTRAPSPDKLLPQSYTNSSHTSSMRSRKSAPTLTLPRPSITEYSLPVDSQSPGYSESLYDYASIASTLDAADRKSNNSTASTRKLTVSYSIGPHILTDYKEPCDVNVPIYSQVDEMVQRPLPLTPLAEQVNNDLGDICGTRL